MWKIILVVNGPKLNCMFNEQDTQKQSGFSLSMEQGPV